MTGPRLVCDPQYMVANYPLESSAPYTPQTIVRNERCSIRGARSRQHSYFINGMSVAHAQRISEKRTDLRAT